MNICKNSYSQFASILVISILVFTAAANALDGLNPQNSIIKQRCEQLQKITDKNYTYIRGTVINKKIFDFSMIGDPIVLPPPHTAKPKDLSSKAVINLRLNDQKRRVEIQGRLGELDEIYKTIDEGKTYGFCAYDWREGTKNEGERFIADLPPYIVDGD